MNIGVQVSTSLISRETEIKTVGGLMPIRMAVNKAQFTNADVDVEKGELSYKDGGNVN